MTPALRKLLLLVLGIPFVMIGTRFLLDAGEALYIDRAAEAWTPQPMTILSRETVTGPDQALGNQTVIRYAYDAGGSRHEEQYSCIGDECPPALLAALDDGGANKTVTGLVNPERSSQSLLSRHIHMPLLLFRIGVGLFCLITGSSAVIFGVYLLKGPATAGRKS